jgi:hypothetical protein
LLDLQSSTLSFESPLCLPGFLCSTAETNIHVPQHPARCKPKAWPGGPQRLDAAPGPAWPSVPRCRCTACCPEAGRSTGPDAAPAAAPAMQQRRMQPGGGPADSAGRVVAPGCSNGSCQEHCRPSAAVAQHAAWSRAGRRAGLLRPDAVPGRCARLQRSGMDLQKILFFLFGSSRLALCGASPQRFCGAEFRSKVLPTRDLCGRARSCCCGAAARCGGEGMLQRPLAASWSRCDAAWRRMVAPMISAAW